MACCIMDRVVRSGASQAAHERKAVANDEEQTSPGHRCRMATLEKMAAKLTVGLLLLIGAFTLDQAEAMPSRLPRMAMEASQQDLHAASPGLNWSDFLGMEDEGDGSDAQVPDHIQNSRRLSTQGIRYTYKLTCGGLTWSKTDACNQNQCLQVGDSQCQHRNTLEGFVFHNNKNQNHRMDWHCAGSDDYFTPGSGGDWNTIFWWRECFSCDNIQWRTYKCDRVGSNTQGEGTTVKLVHPSNGKCLSLPSAGTASANMPYPATLPYGVDEQLTEVACSGSSDQKFFLYPDSPEGNIRLKPFRSVKANLNVCVASNRKTWDCSRASSLLGGQVLSHPTTEGTVLEPQYLIKMTDIPTMPVGRGDTEEVYLVNSAAIGFAALTLQKDSVYGYDATPGELGILQFIPLLSKTETASSFMRENVEENGAEFVLRPKIIFDRNINGCLLNTDPLKLVDCGNDPKAYEESIIWTVADGRIVTKSDKSICLTHKARDGKGGAQLCDPNYKSKSSVSILPQWGNLLKSSDVLFEEIGNQFPVSGIQLHGSTDQPINNGGDDFARIRVNIPSLDVTSNLVIELQYMLDSVVGKQHRVCLGIGVNDWEDWCFYLGADAEDQDAPAQNLISKTEKGDIAKENEVNDFILRPKEGPTMKERFKGELEGQTISYLVFDQEGPPTTRSRFFSIEPYNMLEISGIQNTKDSITVTLGIPVGEDTTGIYYMPSVLMQDSNGNYLTPVPEAEKKLTLSSTNSVTIDNLPSGRRFFIKLSPVSGSLQPFTDKRRTFKTFFHQITTCSCGSDLTGVPGDLVVSQKLGRVHLSFYDRSVCEEAYSFTRQLKSVSNQTTISYAPNYFFYSTSPCSSLEVVSPGHEFGDFVKNLHVGSSYEYCVKAVAKNYMVKVTPNSPQDGASGAFATASNSECKNHTVQWESSVTIKIKLKEEAGSLPVKGVTLIWQIKDPKDGNAVIPIPKISESGVVSYVQSDTATTPENGEVEIPFMIPDLKEDQSYELFVTASKTTKSVTDSGENSVEHEFLCDNEEQLCSPTKPVAYLRHLDFGNEVVISDKTSVPFRGKVTIEKPQDVDTALNPDFDYDMRNLPLAGATVCLALKSASARAGTPSMNCIETNRQGEYALPATLGATVYPEVTYHEHSFRYERNGAVPSTPITEGIYITERGFQRDEYRGHNFVDITTEELIVEVAGGLCNINLGEATVVIRFESNLDAKWKVRQTSYQRNYTVPAHSYFLGVEDLRDMDEIPMQHHLDFLIDTVGQQYVDLKDYSPPPPAPEPPRTPDPPTPEGATEPPTASPIVKSAAQIPPAIAKAKGDAQSQSEGSASLEEGNAAENSRKTARFQYEGKPLIFPSFNGDRLKGPCLEHASTKRQKVPDKTDEYMSTHVIPTGNIMELIVVVREEIIRDEAIPTNSVYCDILDEGDSVVINNEVGLRSDVREDAEILGLLVQSGADVSDYKRCTKGCREPISQPEEALEMSKAEVVLQAGIPNIVSPWYKQIILQFRGIKHYMNVVITGDKQSGDQFFSLPTHFPLLVIRDPPGGTSVAHYENMQSSASITYEEYEKYTGLDAGLRLAGALDFENQILAPNAVKRDEGFFKADSEVEASTTFANKFLNDIKDDEFSHEFTVTWTYTTSDEAVNSGQDSDMFLVPVINVLYATTYTITFNATTCSPFLEPPKIKIDLQAPQNKRSFFLINYEHAKSVEMSNLKGIIKVKNDTLMQNPDDAEAKEDFKLAVASYNSWDKFIKDYEKTNELAEAGLLPSVADWWDVYTEEFIKPLCEFKEWTWKCMPEKWEGAYLTPDGSSGPKLLNCTTGDCVVQDSEPSRYTHGTTSGSTEPRIYDRFARVFRCNREDPLVSTPIAKYDTYTTREIECKESDSLFLCNPEDSQKYDSKPTDYYSSSGELPSCEDVAENVDGMAEFKSANDTVGLKVSNWTRIPEDHPFWEEFLAFYNPVANGPAAGLAPDELLSEAEIDPETESLANEILPQSKLESTGRFVFSGGGGEFEMSLGSEQLRSLTRKYDDDGVTVGPLDNAHQSMSAGVGLDAVGQVGIVAAEVGAFGDFLLDVDHKKLSEEDVSSETTVGFVLSDPDMDDEFIVDIYLDPKFGTFIFHTVGGRSMCPNEKGTEKVELPEISMVERPGGKIRPDEDMIFDIHLRNNGLSDSWFTFYVDSIYIQDGVLVDIVGQGYEADFNLRSTQSDPTAVVKAQVTVSRGPRLFEYNPIKLNLQSTCEKDLGRFARMTSYVLPDSSGALDDTELYNVGIESDNSARIKFLEPCPAVAVVGEMSRKGYFHVNQNTNKISISDEREYLDVGIYNPIFSSRGKLKAQSRVQKVLLEYRKVGIVPWGSAMDKDNQVIDMKEVEDPYGYSNVRWPVPSQDAEYEIRVRVDCNSDDDPSGLPDDLKEFATTIIPGVVDRLKPKVFGHPEPQVNLLPGESLVVHFSEDIWCVEPYIFSVNIIVEELDNRVFEMGTSGGLDVICSGNTLEIQFAEDLSNSTGKLDNTDRAYFDKLLGRNFNLTISGVSDLRRNVMEPYEFYSRFMCLPPVPHLSMTHPDADRPYLPDEEILFNVTLANNGRDGNAFLELAVLQQSNPDNLEVFVHGQSLAIAHQYVFEAGESLPVTVSVKKGPGDKLHFKPIQLYLRSTCEEDNHEQATAFVSLYNHDEDGVKSIVFQHPCPEVRFAGAMHREPYFIMNKNLLQSTKELFGVSIFNVDYKNRRLHERSVDLQGSEPSNRLTEVVLNYRRKGSIGWSKGKTVVSDSNRTELDFSRDGVENSYGYATLQWDVSEITLDSEFEVKVVSSCTPLQGSHSELNEFSSEISSGVIDRNPPKLFGVPTLSLENSHYPSPNHPTKDFVLRFDEAIYCEEPFTFALVVTVTDDAGASVDFLDNEGLVVKCFGNDITYRFDLTSDSDFDRLSNSKVSISLSGVEDLARNVMDDPFTTSYDQCDQSLSHAKVYRGMGCDRFDNDCDLLIDECDEDIVAPTIEFPGHLIDSSSTNGEGELTHLLRDVCFDTVTRANAFLYANIAVEDDCAKDVRLDVVYIQDVSRPGRATFRATATDERCEGIGGDHIHSELFQVEIFENYTTLGLYDDDTIVMGMACDGRDQNCNGIIDDCDEDRIPPTITFKDALTVSAFERKSDGVTFIDSPTFQTLDSGEAYLYSIIKAEDDCATDMTVVVEPISQVQCDKTLFKVTISDPRCPDNNIQTVERIFALKIDDVDPVVSIGFELVPHSTYYDDEGQYLHIEETNYDFDPVFFHYNVDENCQQANVQVEVTVLSNEIEYAKTDGNSMVIMQKRNDDRQSHGIQIFVEPRMCARSETELKPLCEYDIGSAAVRYYKVHVKAIDYSGNVGVSEATVIVLHERWKTTFKDFKDTYQQSDFFINHVDSSPPPHRVLARMETVWDSTLSSAFEPTLMRQSSTSVLPVWNIELESSMTMSGLVLSDNSEERQTQFAVLTSTIKQTVESSLSDGDTISDVTITSAETLPLQSRRRMGQMQLQYVITITSQCVEECNETEDDVGASLASTVGELMEEEIGNGNFMAALSANVLLLADESPGNDILTSSRQQLSSDALNGLLSLSVTSVDADINFSVSSQLDAATSFSVPGMVWFANSDASSLTDIEMVTFLDDLKNMLSNLACSGIAVDICIVVIASINGNATSSPQRRHLESTVLAFEYVVHLEASCSDLDCSDVDSSAISDEIETAIADAVSTGSLANNLRSSSVVASSIIASVTAGPTNSPTQAPEGWYPDLVTRTGTCFDDGNLPSFMRSNETEWLESEKEDCCRIHFPEYFEYHICMGDVTGWFPYWQDDVHTCINDASKVPAYMKQNSELWLLPDLETCCTRHYSWAMKQCLLLGGGMDSISATNLWYVNWKEENCVQDCLAQTGETAGDLICGGLAQNEELFETVEDCCSTKLHWITEGVCVVKSTSVESPQGSEKWYVQYTDQKCVQDCPKDQVDPTCGGVVDDARVPLYDNPALCCHESLNWIYIYDCLTVSGAVIR